MSLDLVIKTGDASSQIEKIRDNLSRLRTQLDGFSGNSSLETTLTRIASFQGLKPGVVQSIADLGKALDSIKGTGNNIGYIAANLSSLKGLNIGTTVNNIQKLADGLSRLRVPTGLTTIASSLSAIGSAAQTAASGVNTLASGLNKIRAPNLGGLVSQVQSVGSSAQSASQGIWGLGNAVSTATGILAGFGVSLGGVGFAMFIKDAWEAQRVMNSFKVQMEGVTGSGATAAKELDYITAAAFRLGQPLGEATQGYLRMYRAVAAAGGETQQARTLFEGLSSALTVTGAGAAESERAFRAFSQMLNKGKITAEEFTQQLGEIFPAMQLLSQALGKTPAEITKMMEAGELGLDAILKLGQQMADTYGPQLSKALNTPQGALNQLSTALDIVKTSFGSAFGEAVKSGLQSLTSALVTTTTTTDAFGKSIEKIELTSFGNALASVGSAIGSVFGTMASVIGTVGQNWNAFSSILLGVTTALGSLISIPVSAWLGAAATAVGVLVKAMGPWPVLLGTIVGGVNYLAQTMGGWGKVIEDAKLSLYGLLNALGLMSDATYNQKVDQYYASLERLKGSVQSTAGVVSSSTSSFSSASTAVQTLGEKITATAAVSPQLEAGIDALATSSNNLDTMLGMVSSSSTEASFGMTKLDEKGTSLDEHLGSAADTGNRFAGIITKAGTESQKASTGLNSAATSTGAIADKAGEAVTPTDQLATNMGNLNTNAAPAATATQQLAGGIAASATAAGQAIGQIDALAAAYRRLAAAAAAAKKAQSGGGGDTGGGEVTTSEYSGGGISHLGTGRLRSVPISAFANAPSFAGGTSSTNSLSASVAGGGIPAILHSNEAVVPLTGGGEIPIATSGGPATGGGGNAIGLVLTELLSLAQLDFVLQTEIKTEIYRVWESFDLFTQLSTEHWAKSDQYAQQMIDHLGVMRSAMLLENDYSQQTVTLLTAQATKFDDLTKAFNDGITNLSNVFSEGMSSLSSSISSAMSSTSSSNSSSSSSSSSSQAGNVATNGSSTSPPADRRGYRRAGFNAIGGGEADSKYSQTFGYGNQVSYGLNKETGRWERIANAGGRLGSPNLWRDARGLPQYEEGTPNTSAEEKRMLQGGGFFAILHPNEAVIPLPDGRSVPVVFPDGIPAGYEAGGGSSQTNVIKVEMTVVAKDADSFRQSSKQIAQQLEAELRAAVSKLGGDTVVDDPTKRVA